MAREDKQGMVTIQELMGSNLATADALASLESCFCSLHSSKILIISKSLSFIFALFCLTTN